MAPATSEGSLRAFLTISRAQSTILIVLLGVPTPGCPICQNTNFRRRGLLKSAPQASITCSLDMKACCYIHETSTIPRARRDEKMVLKARRPPSVILDWALYSSFWVEPTISKVALRTQAWKAMARGSPGALCIISRARGGDGLVQSSAASEVLRGYHNS